MRSIDSLVVYLLACILSSICCKCALDSYNLHRKNPWFGSLFEFKALTQVTKLINCVHSARARARIYIQRKKEKKRKERAAFK